MIEDALRSYLLSNLILVAITAVYLLQNRRKLILFSSAYWRFLFQPWKLSTFLISGTVVTFLGPFTIDYTWDYINGGFMSVLTFATAPWSVGTLYKVARRKAPLAHGIAAISVWLFSASYSYDWYLLLRDGFYPPTWSSNLVLSSILYFSAGCMWNLEWSSTNGVQLAFRRDDWPECAEHRFSWKIIVMAVPFMLIAAYLTLGLLKVFH